MMPAINFGGLIKRTGRKFLRQNMTHVSTLRIIALQLHKGPKPSQPYNKPYNKNILTFVIYFVLCALFHGRFYPSHTITFFTNIQDYPKSPLTSGFFFYLHSMKVHLDMLQSKHRHPAIWPTGLKAPFLWPFHDGIVGREEHRLQHKPLRSLPGWSGPAFQGREAPAVPSPALAACHGRTVYFTHAMQRLAEGFLIK